MVSSRAGFVVGGDIGGTNVRVAAADLFGEPICDLKRPTAKNGGRAVGMQVLEMVTAVIDQAGAVHGPPLALGISSPGVVDQTSGRVTSLAYNVVPEGGFDPLEVIRDRFDLPVLVENNVNLAAVGEKWFGLARGVSTMVFIAIGAGIGMGIIIDDEVVRGAHGAAGEIGYLPLVSDPFNPRHRLHGGLEDEIGAAGIVAAFNERRAVDDPELSSVHDVFELAAAGNAAARAVVDHVASRLGTAIATVCAILDPELVVLGGGIGVEPAAAAPGSRRGRGAGSDHGPDRDQPAGRARRAAGSDRRRPAYRPDHAALPGRASQGDQDPGPRGAARPVGGGAVHEPRPPFAPGASDTTNWKEVFNLDAG